MQYTRLGNSGLIVSRLAFGAMTFGSAKGTVFEAISKVDEKLATELVARALDSGINHFNTADVYTGGPVRANTREGTRRPKKRRRDFDESWWSEQRSTDSSRSVASPHSR